MPADPLSVDVQLNPADLQALARLTNAHPQGAQRTYWALRTSLWAALLFASLLHPIVWIAVGLEAGLLVLEQRLRRATRSPRAYDTLNGRYSVENRGLLRSAAAMGQTLIVWSAIEQVSQTGDHLNIRFSGTGWVLPFRCFSSEDHRRGFVAELQRHLDGAASGTTK